MTFQKFGGSENEVVLFVVVELGAFRGAAFIYREGRQAAGPQPLALAAPWNRHSNH